MEENIYSLDPLMAEETLEEWVMVKVEDWRDFFESNHEEQFDEYYRLWRGIWDPADRERSTERSRIISPALQQAVESNVAELEEATFGRGKWFAVSDDMNDPERMDVEYLQNKLMEDFGNTKIRKSVAECLLNAAVFGTGIAEVILDEVKEMKPAVQPMMEGQLQAVGVNIEDRIVVKMKPILPQNFLIEPVATSVESAVGVAIDEFVSSYDVEEMQEKGIYKDVYVGTAAPDSELEPDQDITVYSDDKVRLTKYYGKVPRELLRKAMMDDDEEEMEEEIVEGAPIESKYVEAIVIIANGGTLLKAEENPYMMQDRPVVAFPWDVVPGRFWGRGVCEKGYNSQKALDTELRARIDALALTIHPMLAIDATRLPRGSKPEVRPGKVILTNGDPREVLQPFNFGQVSQITFAQAASLQQMVQQATGAVDSAGIAGQVNGEATAAGISMSLGAVIKRHKRTLINFQESFLLPFVKKAAYRYMQFDPENYPVADYKFNATSTLGIIAREYEVTQLVQLLQTMPQDSPVYPLLIESIVENMNLSNREELLMAMKQAQQPNPQAAEAAQAAQQSQLALQQSQTSALQAQAMESQAKAEKYAVEAQLAPEELEIDKIEAITRNLQAGDQDDREFERRLKVANLVLTEQKMEKRRQANDDNAKRNAEANRPSEQQLLAALQQAGGAGGQGQGNGGLI